MSELTLSNDTSKKEFQIANVNHISDKALVSKIYRELLQLNKGYDNWEMDETGENQTMKAAAASLLKSTLCFRWTIFFGVCVCVQDMVGWWLFLAGA